MDSLLCYQESIRKWLVVGPTPGYIVIRQSSRRDEAFVEHYRLPGMDLSPTFLGVGNVAHFLHCASSVL